MTQPELEALVFDLDHTLFDRYGTLRGIAYLLKRRFARQLNPSLCAARLGEMLVAADKAYIYHGWPVIYENLVAQGMFIDPPPYQEYFAFFMEAFQQVAVPIPLVCEMLAQLKAQGFKLGLITNGSASIQRPKLRLLRLDHAFDQVIIGKEFGIEKPAPEPFEAMARRLGCKPQRIAYVGDHPLNDMEGARRAGYTPIWVKTSGTWPFPELLQAPYAIDDVLELPQLLAKLGAQERLQRISVPIGAAL